jgi:hypothetical protein
MMKLLMSMVLGGVSLVASAQGTGKPRVLDDFSDPASWRVVTSNQVTAALRRLSAGEGGGLCLDYDYNGVSGYAAIRRRIAIDYPDNYRFDFRLRGDSPRNDLQFKLLDASGDNVWWVNRPRYDFQKDWTPVRYLKRHIDKAWGPDPDKTLRKSAEVEFTLYNNAGGKGSVCFDALSFTPLPAEDPSPLQAKASANVGASTAAAVVEAGVSSAWTGNFDGTLPALTLDLGKLRDFGGLRLDWVEGQQATDYRVQLSDDGKAWRDGAQVSGSNGGTDWIALRETQARYVRVRLDKGLGKTFALRAAGFLPLKFSDTPNDTLAAMAAEAPKGRYPRGFSDQQPYWTLVGIDGGTQQGLIGEDGAIEVGRGMFAIEPFVVAGGKLHSWADVEVGQSLQDGYLPIPEVTWKHAAFSLKTTAFAAGTVAQSQLAGRYVLTNTSDKPQRLALVLAARPMQVNPPRQFLSTQGGYTPISTVSVDAREMTIAQQADGQARVVRTEIPADAALASSFAAGEVVERLDDIAWPQPCDTCRIAALPDRVGPSSVLDAAHADPAGMASAAWIYEVDLAPGASRAFGWITPMTGALPQPGQDLATLQEQVADGWRSKLDQVKFTVPAAGQDLIDTLRTATAHMLMSRVGPRLQPGTRSYNRSWIRDGAMISEGLLRMGRSEVVRDYVQWYAPYQFKDGMVPCCVDDRGSDPVPENDSHGELIFNIAEYWRYTGDTEFLERMWPHVQGAYGYMEKLRLSERTEGNRARNAAFYGMMPVSISHEGYSAKPVHSYWDNFWALRGYKDAVDIAQALGHHEEARRYALSRDQFRDDLQSSLTLAARQHGLDFLPGSAELGDFDATSTTIALAPGGEQGRLPQPLLDNTFERYWKQLVERRDGSSGWKDYTPYEWRNAAAFVRLGWRERTNELVEYFFAHRTPQPWHQWAEVVSRTPRVPFFVGDLPHAWVESDFVRAALDMFAYKREIDDSIVLAAGIPSQWLGQGGIAIDGMRTPHGALSYRLRRQGGQLLLDVPAGMKLPEGGLTLPWPYPGTPGRTTINGKAAKWDKGELRIRQLPATVKIAVQ